jgi:arylsulfatase A-like enzyme
MSGRVLLAVVVGAWAWVAQGAGVRAEEAEEGRPNVLFVIADDWGFGHAGAYGCSWVKTPAFDRVAREGVLFQNAFTNNPKCSPCRASILTGRNTWQLEEACNHNGVFPAKWAVYPDLLEEAGYHVGFTGKGWGPGDFKAGGFQRNPAGPAYQKFRKKAPLGGVSAVDYARNFEDFLSKREPGQPFCFWYGGQEPHRGYEPGSGIRAGRDPSKVTLPAYFPDNRAVRSDYLDYALEVEWFDSHLGKFLEKLEEIGEIDNTLIVVTSDHGEPFPRVKGQIYEKGFHIPLAIRWGKKIKAGREVEDFVNVRDFAPTLLEAAGVKAPESMSGRSFLDVLRAEESGRVDPSRNRMLVGKERHDIGRPHDACYPVRGLRTPEYLYIRNFEPSRWPVGNPETGYRNCDDGPTKELILAHFNDYYRLCFGKRPSEELYRIDKDGECLTNLADDPKYADVKNRLYQEMAEMLRKDEDPRILGRGEVFETYKYLGNRDHSYEAWKTHNGTGEAR